MKSADNEYTWNIGMLPFIWKELSQPTNGDRIPDKLPFSLQINVETGLIMQMANIETSAALSHVYSLGSSITGMMNDTGIGKDYAEDFLSFFQHRIQKTRFDNLKILEIGCGTGYLLHRIQQLGGECTGIEPGQHGQESKNKFGINIIHDFFPSNKIEGKFDIIIFYGVLEHTEHPVTFLNQLKPFLHKNSIIVLCVPNCEPYLHEGDLSILIHEHWSYFTKHSLETVLSSAGFHNIKVTSPDFSNILYAAAELDTDLKNTSKTKNISVSINNFSQYKKSAKLYREAIIEFIKKIKSRGLTLAIYVPTRLINILVLEKIDVSHCRFFDDNPLLYGKYYPGINIRVESQKELVNNPTDVVLIMSASFGDSIEKNLKNIIPDNVEIVKSNDLI